MNLEIFAYLTMAWIVLGIYVHAFLEAKTDVFDSWHYGAANFIAFIAAWISPVVVIGLTNFGDSCG